MLGLALATNVSSLATSGSRDTIERLNLLDIFEGNPRSIQVLIKLPVAALGNVAYRGTMPKKARLTRCRKKKFSRSNVTPTT
jgi:hypothetical protein